VGALMVQGTCSGAGKSLLATALCRHFARRGVRVAPFKAQNMSNNARVVQAGEIGVAQYLQALAARVQPDVRMNPVLVKPESLTSSQVVVQGRVDLAVSALPWPERARHLWPVIEESLRSLLDEYELVVLEGAGSPAEINLADTDLANARTAHAADAPVLLVSDIDRGGAFAHLYGTWALIDRDLRQRIAGFVLNKFRGDPALLAPAPERLTELTGVPMLGVVPWLEHGLPDEDSATTPSTSGNGSATVAIVRYPTASNLDEFKALEQVALVRWASRPPDLQGAELVVLPGSKHVAGDLAWLRSAGLDRAVRARVRAGGRVLGVCGGLQMLGEQLRDPDRLDGDDHGLGLLPLRTTFRPAKLTRRRAVRFATDLATTWAPLAGRVIHGYEIRQGQTEPIASVQEALPGGLGWVRGPVLGIAVHGLLEDAGVLAALLGAAPDRSLDAALDELTDAVIAGVQIEEIEQLAGVRHLGGG
jgi:adenosylcobyric acid synthase